MNAERRVWRLIGIDMNIERIIFEGKLDYFVSFYRMITLSAPGSPKREMLPVQYFFYHACSLESW